MAEVTSLGLVQMTRKRVGSGLLEAFSEVCECCNGRGIHVSLTPVEEKPEQTGNGNTASRKRKRKGEIERVVEAKVAKQEAVIAADAVDDDDDFVVDAAQPIADPVPAEAPKPRTRTRRTRPAGPPPEDTEDIGTVAITLETGETVRVEAVVGDPDAEIVVEEAEDMAPKRRRSRRPTRAEKIEAAKSDAPE